MMEADEKNSLAPGARFRIAFCITELNPGGAERQLVQLVTNLDRDRFEPEVICLSGEGPLVGSLKDAGVRVTCLHARGRCDATILFRLRRHLRETRPHIVQTFLFHANIAGRIAARLAGVPVVVSGIRVAERRRWHLRLDRLTDRLVDRHVCVSNAVAEFSARVARLPAAKLAVIPNGVDVDRLAAAAPADLSEFGLPHDARVILFVGRLDYQKDPIRLLDAFRRLAPENAAVILMFVGEGPLEAKLRYSAIGLGRRVLFVGFRDDVPRLLKASSCLALPSRWEGMPNVVLEAMAVGTPVVAADVEGVGELLQQGTLGTIVKEPGPEPLAKALRETLNGRAAALAKTEETQAIARQRYTASEMLRAYQRLYVDLMLKPDLT